MISLKIGGIIVAAFIAGAFVASPELRAYAANTVFSTDIVDGEVKTADIGDGQVMPNDLATSAVTNAKIAPNAISTTKIGTGGVTNSDIAGDAVTTGKIRDGQVMAPDIAEDAVGASEIQAGGVRTAEIADGTITYFDASRSFITIEHRDDCDCGGTGWDPNGQSSTAFVFDDSVTANSVVSITTNNGGNQCETSVFGSGSFQIVCLNVIPQGAELNYAIFNHP